MVSCSSLILKSTSSIIGPQLLGFLRERDRRRSKSSRLRAEKKGRLARHRHHHRALREQKNTVKRSSPAPSLEPSTRRYPERHQRTCREEQLRAGARPKRRGTKCRRRGRRQSTLPSAVVIVVVAVVVRRRCTSLPFSLSSFLCLPIDVHLVALVRGLVLPVGVPPGKTKERGRRGERRG